MVAILIVLASYLIGSIPFGLVGRVFFKIQEISTNKEILNCFCYTDGFTLNALCGGAKFVTSIDSSEQALQMAKLRVETNGLQAKKPEWIEADVFKSLRKF